MFVQHRNELKKKFDELSNEKVAASLSLASTPSGLTKSIENKDAKSENLQEKLIISLAHLTTQVSCEIKSIQKVIRQICDELDQFSPDVHTLEDMLRKKHLEVAALKKRNDYFISSVQEFLKSETIENSKNQSLKSGHILNHILCALSYLDNRINSLIFNIVLCEEDIVLYKNEMHYFRCLGVTNIESDGFFEFRKTLKNHKESNDSVLINYDNDKIHSSLISQQWAKLSHSPSAEHLFKKGLRSGQNDHMKANSLIENPEELLETGFSENLSVENALLLKRQTDASIQEAQKVEESAREISRLTSLISDTLVQQSESVLQLQKNVTQAEVHLKGVTKEMRKAREIFWNATRMMIAFSWVMIFFLLAAHYLIR